MTKRKGSSTTQDNEKLKGTKANWALNDAQYN